MNENELETAPVVEIEQTAPEVSADLAAMLSESNKAAPENQPETLPPLEAQPVLDKDRIAVTEKVIINAAGFVAYQAQSMTGRSLGVDEKIITALAKGVAPCLVKYGLGEPSELFSKWGVEMQAAIAVGTVAFKIWESERQHKQQLQAEQARITQAQANQMTTANPMGAVHGN